RFGTRFIRDADTLQIHPEIFLLGWDAERLEVAAAQAAEFVGRQSPGHHVVGEIRHGMAERRELPVEHREHARLAWMKDHVVEPIIAVNNGDRVAWRNI